MTRIEQIQEESLAWASQHGHGKTIADAFEAGAVWGEKTIGAYVDTLIDLEHDHKIMKEALEKMSDLVLYDNMADETLSKLKVK